MKWLGRLVRPINRQLVQQEEAAAAPTRGDEVEMHFDD